MNGLFVKLDVEYAFDDKLIAAGPLAELLYVRSLAFCKRNVDSDGRIHTNQLAAVGFGIPSTKKHAAALVESGAWETTSTGWQITGWLKRNKSGAQIADEKEMRRVASVEANHAQHHVGPGKKRSAKCELCRPISEPESEANRSRNRLQEPEPEAEAQPEPEPETEPSPPHLSTTPIRLVQPVDDDRLEPVINKIVRIRADKAKPNNPQGWAVTVRARLITDEMERIRDYLDRFPDAPYDVIAAAVEGDTSSLRYYQQTGTG